MENAEKLAEEHWEWVGRLLAAGGIDTAELIGFLYREAFIHGYKHARDDDQDNRDSTHVNLPRLLGEEGERCNIK